MANQYSYRYRCVYVDPVLAQVWIVATTFRYFASDLSSEIYVGEKESNECVACFSCEAPGGLGGKMVVISGCEREDF